MGSFYYKTIVHRVAFFKSQSFYPEVADYNGVKTGPKKLQNNTKPLYNISRTSSLKSIYFKKTTEI